DTRAAEIDDDVGLADFARPWANRAVGHPVDVAHACQVRWTRMAREYHDLVTTPGQACRKGAAEQPRSAGNDTAHDLEGTSGGGLWGPSVVVYGVAAMAPV